MHLSKSILSASALLTLALFSGTHSASASSWLVDINTATLGSGPFSLDFTLNTGGIPQNTVSISGFTLTGGAFTGTPSFFGSTSGSFGSGLTLTSGTFQSSEATDAFSSTTTDIKFLLTATTNQGIAPDLLEIGILNSTGYIPTTDPVSLAPGVPRNDLGNVTLTTIPLTQSFTSTSPAGATISFTAVPEPSSAMALMGGVAVLLGLGRARRRIAA